MPFVCRSQSLNPRYSRVSQPDGNHLWELDLNLEHIPLNNDVSVVCEYLILGELAEQVGSVGRFQFTLKVDTGLMQVWMLMPEGRRYEAFEISAFPIGHPELAETIEPTTTVQLPIGSIATFQLINPRHDYQYECHWRWIE